MSWPTSGRRACVQQATLHLTETCFDKQLLEKLEDAKKTCYVEQQEIDSAKKLFKMLRSGNVSDFVYKQK